MGGISMGGMGTIEVWPNETTDAGLTWMGDLWNLSDTLPQPVHCPSLQMPVGNFVSMFLYGIVCVVGLLGNTLVIYVVLRFTKMQTVTNMYILNLAIADECFLIGIPFLITTMYLGEWKFGSTVCKGYMISTSITQFTSSIFLFIMSADRYIAVCHPISSPRYRTAFVSKIVSAVAWVTSALTMVPIMLYANTAQTFRNRT
uniref:G-protein coupled receptors family 1 profile domain-containing protein n=2 Tax=Lutzomyia longipalpis TaxID=7200 RepID=A0A1B0GI60_LUTLO